MKTIDKVFESLEEINFKIDDREKFKDFLFEYACQKFESHKVKNYIEGKNVEMAMVNQVLELYNAMIYFKVLGKYPPKIHFKTPEKEFIPKMLKYENEHPEGSALISMSSFKQE